jgi:hypothetical protein
LLLRPACLPACLPANFPFQVEVVRDRELAISFLHHMAVQRRVRNPFETSDVVRCRLAGWLAGWLAG